MKSRMKAFIRSQNLTQQQFRQALGLSVSWVDSLKDSIHPATRLALAEKFPDLNISWLLTGVGTMLHSQAAAGAVPPGPSPLPGTAGAETSTNNNMTKDDFLQILKRKDDQLSELIYQNRVLTDVIARLTGAEHSVDTNSPPPEKIGSEAIKTTNSGVDLGSSYEERAVNIYTAISKICS